MTGLLSVLNLQGQDFASLQHAEDLFHRTEYQSSIALLDKNSTEGRVNFLLGRDFFMLSEFKRAAESLEKAVSADPANSEYWDWLGRAYGRRAETSSALTAPGFASKARQAFEKAVQLDGRNREALSDLFDYYLQAPGLLGGGYDKAVIVAEKMSRVDPTEGYFARARLAERHRDFNFAEEHLRKAVAIAPHEVNRLLSLAKFLARQGRTSESDELFVEASRKAPDAPAVWFARADTFIQQKRNLEEAKTLLQRYVRASLTANDPPKQDAVRLLKRVGGV